ncbi:MAG: cystathionine beta-lyase [Pseudomonadota bacterium]
MSKKDQKEETRMIHGVHNPRDHHGVVNPPITRTSTLIYPSLKDFEDPTFKYDYGRHMTPTMDVFIKAVTELENGYDGIVGPCGLAVITTSLLGFLKTGDHLLMVDSTYYPVRRFCEQMLKSMGIEVTYYDPRIGANIEELIQDNTRVIYMETPGSATFDVQDVPAITKAAKDHNIVTMVDSTWSSGVLFKPLDHGADISLISCTKYINGYADGMLGVGIAKDENKFRRLKKASKNIGLSAGSEELNLGIRGLKTIHIRMKEAGERALEMAQWLEEHDDVQRVFHPALMSHPDHELWKRDFSGCNGLMSILLPPSTKDAFRTFIESSELFGLGDSWGAFESLMQPQYIDKTRTAVPWKEDGYLVRLQIGFEDIEDLKQDLERAFKAFREANT